MKFKRRLKQIFCLHIKWELHSNPNSHHAKARDLFVWKCENCGKLKLGEGLRV